MTRDIYSYSATYESENFSGENLIVKPSPSFGFGINYGWQLTDHFAIETGFFLKTYKFSFGFANQKRNEYVNFSLNSLMRVPLRFRYRFEILNDKLYLFASTGISMAFNRTAKNDLVFVSGTSNDVNGIPYDYYCYLYSSTGSLIEPRWFVDSSLGLGIPIKNLYISMEANFTKGLNIVHTGLYTYNTDVNNVVQRTGAITGFGDNFGGVFKFIYYLNK